MYHISCDKRAIRSAEKIENGLLRCLNGKSLAEITVTDVQKESAVGRATFYRLFDNTADVLIYLCDNVFEQAGKEYKKSPTLNAEQTTLTFIKVWMKNKLLLKTIVACNRTDIIFDSHKKYLLPLKNMLFKESNIDEIQASYLMAMLTACTSATLAAWLTSGANESAEQIQARLKGCFAVLGQIFA